MPKSSRLPLLILCFIQFLFVYKYSARFSEWPFFIGIISILMLCLIVYFQEQIQGVFKKAIWRTLLITVFFCLGLMGLLFIDASTLNVDRHSVISSFWEQFFNGEYVYFAQSHMGNYPGPMPFYFILALPFYVLGEVGLFSLAGVILVLFYFHKNGKKEEMSWALLFLATLAPTWWEIIARSNLYFNSGMMLFALAYVSRDSPDQKPLKMWQNGMWVGLTMAIRNIFILPLSAVIVNQVRFKKMSWNLVIFLGVVSILFFTSSFIPFVAGQWESFTKMNPFIVQSSFLIPPGYVIIFVTISILIGAISKNLNYFELGLTLFLPILIYFVYHGFTSGFHEALINSKADLSYFIFGIPFFIKCLLKQMEVIDSEM